MGIRSDIGKICGIVRHSVSRDYLDRADSGRFMAVPATIACQNAWAIGEIRLRAICIDHATGLRYCACSLWDAAEDRQASVVGITIQKQLNP